MDGAIANLRARLRGILIQRGDAGYDEARALWNGMIDNRPALIVRCQDADDVIAALNFAREQGLVIAVRGGGHNVAGLASADGGMVIDLREMRSVQVDPEARIARAQGGATWADVDQATQSNGLATPGGMISATGIAGLTLGGGMGWLRRKCGLSCDNLIAAEVVTADGRLLRASETENPDLLWGLRGGGGNFGIVTLFEYQLHPVGPEVAFTLVLYPMSRANEVLRAYRAYMEDAPDEVSPLVALGRVPHAETFPKEIQGEPCVLLAAMYAGGPQGERVMRPLRELAEPLFDASGVTTYLEVQTMNDADYPNGRRYYLKSANIMGLTDEVIDRLVLHAKAAPSDHAAIDIWSGGGAMSRVPTDATAYRRRDLHCLVNFETNWQDPAADEASIAWVRGGIADIQHYGDGSLYLNFPGFLEEGEAMVRSFFGANYSRLVELKNKYDPGNAFRRNQNIKPTTPAGFPAKE